MIAIGCHKEQKGRGWWSKVEFVDSTYTKGKTEYLVGETVYILFTGECHFTEVPEIMGVELYRNLGDYEIVFLAAHPCGHDTLTNPRFGKISTRGDSGYIKRNDTLEISPSDTIIVFCGCRTFPGEDTAYIRGVK
jgi:hypothetical protein